MSGCADCAAAVRPPAPRVRTAVVALIGPPNSGKSTLFNELTGLRQKVANYAGVTVEHRVGRVLASGSLAVELIDLPGTFSLQPQIGRAHV